MQTTLEYLPECPCFPAKPAKPAAKVIFLKLVKSDIVVQSTFRCKKMLKDPNGNLTTRVSDCKGHIGGGVLNYGFIIHKGKVIQGTMDSPTVSNPTKNSLRTNGVGLTKSDCIKFCHVTCLFVCTLGCSYAVRVFFPE